MNVQSCLSTIDIESGIDATLNMNRGVQFQPVGTRLFNTNPFAIAFKRSGNEGFVALAATDRLLRVTVNDDGVPDNQPAGRAPPADPGNIVRIELKDPTEILTPDPEDRIGGKNPRGLVINSTDTRAYVMDFLSRDIAVVDISGSDPALVQNAGADRVDGSPGRGQRRRDVAAWKAAVQLVDWARGRAGQLQTSCRTALGFRMGDVLQLPSPGADRHRHMDVRRWSAAGDFHGEHV